MMQEKKIFPDAMSEVTLETLASMNVPQSAKENRAYLSSIGEVEGFARKLGLDLDRGFSDSQVLQSRDKFGENVFPAAPMTSFFELLIEALSDTTLLILVGAAVVSLIVEILEDPAMGWIDGTSILIAVMLCSLVTSCNNYSKELQFRKLEESSAQDEKCSVIRNGVINLVNPHELVVGDLIILQVGDSTPADCIVCDNNVVKSSESSLTGEPEDLKKSKKGDCFLLSSCLVTEGESSVKAIVIGIGACSQWGKIKSTLVSENVETPLQEKLGLMAQQIGQVGLIFAILTFGFSILAIFIYPHEDSVGDMIIHAFIISIVVVVVAIPEGLPLAVTISLAYSTGKMYDENCNIRVLAACETMGNATTICSDKTGTLTQNRMTVVEGWFGDMSVGQDNFLTASSPCRNMVEGLTSAIVDQCCINRVAYLAAKKGTDTGVNVDVGPEVVGNKTEGALIIMVKNWGYNYETIETEKFNEMKDKKYSFNSTKKRSSTVLHLKDGTVRLLCKGAPEYILADCTSYYSNALNKTVPFTKEKRDELEEVMRKMTERALRILCLSHKDFKSVADLPPDWRDNCPDGSDLICDCIVGIIDPLRDDVKHAVATAQRAGVVVRMVTGDGIATAKAIARNCGILTDKGIALEGPRFRNMAPRELDSYIHRLQVLARSSPQDKLLLVTRLNGRVPDGEEEWKAFHKGSPNLTWEADRDKVLPGYRAEWEASDARPGATAEVVGVTGDGTNDAPALKAANVGLSMGITGTKVAQSASDIVIRDDKFSSIVTAILWGRSVYDNIRKFLQFQLSVNVCALIVVLTGAIAGFEPPLNAIMMLWVNLIMDTMGALALGTETPLPELLDRKPYKIDAGLISRPMARNILCQSAFQLILIFTLLFSVSKEEHKPIGWCAKYKIKSSSVRWQVGYPGNSNGAYAQNATGNFGCSDFSAICSGDRNHQNCMDSAEDTDFDFKKNPHLFYPVGAPEPVKVRFSKLSGFEDKCLQCVKHDYYLTSYIFNAFVFCQLFNEFNARSLLDKIDVISGVEKNPVFVAIIFITIGLQILIVTFGGEFVKTEPLSVKDFLVTVGFGALAIPVGWIMRFIPVKEDPNSFAVHDMDLGGAPIADEEARSLLN